MLLTLKKLKEEGLMLNGKKYEFCKDSITFLSHHVSLDGMTPDLDQTGVLPAGTEIPVGDRP